MISLSVKVFFSARWREATRWNFGRANAGHATASQRDRSQGERRASAE